MTTPRSSSSSKKEAKAISRHTTQGLTIIISTTMILPRIGLVRAAKRAAEEASERRPFVFAQLILIGC
jgi:hypothetical protein